MFQTIHKNTIQPKLSIGEPDDQYEQEADKVATQVTRMSEGDAPIQRKCNQCEEEEVMHRKEANGVPNIQADFNARLQGTKSSGTPMNGHTRQFMESRMGTDFSNVRIHTGNTSEKMNRDISARAFTHGSDIYFNQNQYQPESDSGKELLAHELMHTVQQKDIQLTPGIQKAAGDDQTHEDTPIRGVTADIISDWAARGGHASLNRSHWFRQINSVFAVMPFVPVVSRFDANTEERDAVLSVLHEKVITTPVTTPTNMVIEIPARPDVAGSMKLYYRFNVIENPDPDTASSKPLQIEIHFLREEAATYTIPDLPAVPASFTSNIIMPPDWHIGQTDSYPGNDSTAFYAARGDLQQEIFHYLETTPAPTGGEGAVNEIFRVTPMVGTDTEEHFLSIDLTFISGETLPRFSVTYLSGTISTENPIATYSEQQDYLGTVNGISAVPANELSSVNYMIDQYFTQDYRNTEIDMIVPIANETYSVYYTLVFHPVGAGRIVNATISRIGRDNAVGATTLDITRVNGYPTTADAAALKTWIIARYPSVNSDDLDQNEPAEGTEQTEQTTEDVRTKINEILVTRANTPAWFTDNYNIEILGPTAAGTRLTTSHNLITDADNGIAQLAGLKSFTADELLGIEFTMQTMSQELIDSYRTRDVKMVRQTILVEEDGSTNASTSGIAYYNDTHTTTGSGATAVTTYSQRDSTVVIFDNAYAADDVSFIGGSSGNVRRSSIGTITHELGHVAGSQFDSLKADFYTFVAANNIDPFTRYASTLPASEFFPEAFALYHNDPEWLNTNYPSLYTWFSTQLSTVH